MTYTKEQLIEEAKQAVEGCRRLLRVSPGVEAHKISLRLAEITLAALTAEPVAYLYKDNLHTDARFSLHTRFGNWSQEDINEYEITEIPLFTAPPAPVSAPAGYRLQSISEYDAMCAAMLQGAEPVTTANKLPELTDSQCLEFIAVAFRHATIKGDIEFDDIRLGLKMALEAAPQQEA